MSLPSGSQKSPGSSRSANVVVSIFYIPRVKRVYVEYTRDKTTGGMLYGKPLPIFPLPYPDHIWIRNFVIYTEKTRGFVDSEAVGGITRHNFLPNPAMMALPICVREVDASDVMHAYSTFVSPPQLRRTIKRIAQKVGRCQTPMFDELDLPLLEDDINLEAGPLHPVQLLRPDGTILLDEFNRQRTGHVSFEGEINVDSFDQPRPVQVLGPCGTILVDEFDRPVNGYMGVDDTSVTITNGHE